MQADERQRLRAALDEMGGILVEIVVVAEQKNRERCPYKTVEMLCTFSGGCQNQRVHEGRRRCVGDQAIFQQHNLSEKSRGWQ